MDQVLIKSAFRKVRPKDENFELCLDIGYDPTSYELCCAIVGKPKQRASHAAGFA